MRVLKSRPIVSEIPVMPVSLLRTPGETSPAARTTPGQAFADLTHLAAMACRAPMAVLSVSHRDGSWSPLTVGFDDNQGLGDRRLYDLIARSDQPVEITDTLTGALALSPLAQHPHRIRWAYGLALRDESGAVIAVLAVLDQALRKVTKRERLALGAVARQLHETFARLGPSWHTAGQRPTPEHDAGDHRNPSHRPTLSDATLAPSSAPDTTADSGASLDGLALREDRRFLRCKEVASLFDVTERTVNNWAAAGKLPSLRTSGGHLRFPRDKILKLLA